MALRRCRARFGDGWVFMPHMVFEMREVKTSETLTMKLCKDCKHAP